MFEKLAKKISLTQWDILDFLTQTLFIHVSAEHQIQPKQVINLNPLNELNVCCSIRDMHPQYM